MYSAPKSVLNHPAVESCTSGEATGGDQKHYVILKEGYWFGPAYRTTSLFFDYVTPPKTDPEAGRVWSDWKAHIQPDPRETGAY